jgi:hypothetical protein
LKKNLDYIKSSNSEKKTIFHNFFYFYSSREDDGYAVVEGPIPLEPEEKLYGSKRDDSKVRQL